MGPTHDFIALHFPLQPMMPVGARGFTLIEADGKDEAGEPKFKMTDLSAIQGKACSCAASARCWRIQHVE